MSKKFHIYLSCWTALLLVACMVFMGDKQANASELVTNPAFLLRTKYAELHTQLARNQFRQPVYIHSIETSDHLNGDIYALVNYPFATVNRAFNNAANWCDVLILHLNTKYCSASINTSGSTLGINIGKKAYQPLDQTYRMEFTYNVTTTTREYSDIRLNAKTGPLGTSDYYIRLEAVSIKGGKTFLHFAYSYAYDYLGGIAMQGYLSTVGRGKVGFTIIGNLPDGQPDYIGGVRGVVERNTMRYYLAIDAYLGALFASPANQLDKRLQSWFASTERYPLQLHEVDRATYIDMKRREYLRQQTTQ